MRTKTGLELIQEKGWKLKVKIEKVDKGLFSSRHYHIFLGWQRKKTFYRSVSRSTKGYFNAVIVAIRLYLDGRTYPPSLPGYKL